MHTYIHIHTYTHTYAYTITAGNVRKRVKPAHQWLETASGKLNVSREQKNSQNELAELGGVQKQCNIVPFEQVVL